MSITTLAAEIGKIAQNDGDYQTALALGLDVDVVLAHAPVDWASSQEAQLFLD